MNQNRREFISNIVAGAAIPMLSNLEKTLSSSSKSDFQISLFSKPLDGYDFDFTCECCKLSGMAGIELTVRKDGRVEPETVESALPDFIRRASKYDLSTNMIVTGILTATDPLTERILKTASSSGVKYYRLGWFNYDKTDIWETLQKCRSVMSELTVLNRKYNIHGGYQNHSGEYVGAPLWDLFELFRNLPPEYIGNQFDVRHAMVEGYDTWKIGMRLISKYIKTLAVKDFTWKNIDGRLQPVTVPLGEGIVGWDNYFKSVKELNIKAPITLHIEYPLLENGEENLPLKKQQEIIVRKLKKDREFINSYLKKYQLIS